MQPLDILAAILFAASIGIMIWHAFAYRRKVIARRRAARGLPPRNPRYRRTPNTGADPFVERVRSNVGTRK